MCILAQSGRIKQPRAAVSHRRGVSQHVGVERARKQSGNGGIAHIQPAGISPEGRQDRPQPVADKAAAPDAAPHLATLAHGWRCPATSPGSKAASGSWRRGSPPTQQVLALAQRSHWADCGRIIAPDSKPAADRTAARREDSAVVADSLL